ncbi:hypothetical protein ACLUXW_08230 [Limosilactobacillus reuteri subsp. suis]|uniref:DUF536 domain-containing protein n=1 Tax=Ligilactobacillus salivarius TaxID=1624 RepID=A0A921ID94_9LACO|nr:hypothetical protein [Ligilactobacillus salivarius]
MANARKKYTMQNMADLIGVNKSSVYRFLKKENISPTIVQNNTQYYSSIALQRVKKHFNTTHTNSNERVDNRDLLINSLQQQIKDLKAELSEEKVRADAQLAEKDKQIIGYQKLVDQSQQLLLNEQNMGLPEKNSVQEGEYSEKPSTHKSTNNDSKNIVILKDQIDPTVLKKVQKKTKKMHWWNKIFRN